MWPFSSLNAIVLPASNTCCDFTWKQMETLLSYWILPWAWGSLRFRLGRCRLRLSCRSSWCRSGVDRCWRWCRRWSGCWRWTRCWGCSLQSGRRTGSGMPEPCMSPASCVSVWRGQTETRPVVEREKKRLVNIWPGSLATWIREIAGRYTITTTSRSYVKQNFVPLVKQRSAKGNRKSFLSCLPSPSLNFAIMVC